MAEHTDSKLLALLEETAQNLGFSLQYVCLQSENQLLPQSKGGLYKLNGQTRIVIEKALPPAEKARLIAQELKRCDLENVYLPPVLRQLLQPF